jgi:hypothetical protein
MAKGWVWDDVWAEWVSDYPENMELEKNTTTPWDWELSYKSLGSCTGKVYVWQEDPNDGIWIVSVEMDGPGVYVDYLCGELPKTGPAPDWEAVENMVGEAHEAIFEECMDQALDSEEGDC